MQTVSKSRKAPMYLGALLAWTNTRLLSYREENCPASCARQTMMLSVWRLSCSYWSSWGRTLFQGRHERASPPPLRKRFGTSDSSIPNVGMSDWTNLLELQCCLTFLLTLHRHLKRHLLQKTRPQDLPLWTGCAPSTRWRNH